MLAINQAYPTPIKPQYHIIKYPRKIVVIAIRALASITGFISFFILFNDAKSWTMVKGKLARESIIRISKAFIAYAVPNRFRINLPKISIKTMARPKMVNVNLKDLKMFFLILLGDEDPSANNERETAKGMVSKIEEKVQEI